ncbi:hypothetical protein L195_g012482 [Trifolium pratense]|uniref:Uncharacterized protein n=1 Tax=Trifolium pratense TaxID=57577 RepID=A0A2K3PKG7_TRIPR|nr:hypothetical protein L195_g012482 [Trifolium pratense]
MGKMVTVRVEDGAAEGVDCGESFCCLLKENNESKGGMSCNARRRRDREWKNAVEDDASRRNDGEEGKENMDQKVRSTVQRKIKRDFWCSGGWRWRLEEDGVLYL